MELLPGIVADGCALYLSGAKALVLSDLHIGYEEEARKRGVLLPKGQQAFYSSELDRLFARHEIEVVILAGDIKHEFGRISQEEWTGVQALIGDIRRRGARVEAVGGNHDVLIEPILKKASLGLKKYLIIRNTDIRNEDRTILIIHGDNDLDTLITEGVLDGSMLKDVDVIIAGHEHPALTLSDGIRQETAKCFLRGEIKHGKGRGAKRYGLVVMPSFNPLAFGTDTLRERPLGPLLATFGGFSAYAVLEDKVLAFGEVKKLQRQQRA